MFWHMIHIIHHKFSLRRHLTLLFCHAYVLRAKEKSNKFAMIPSKFNKILMIFIRRVNHNFWQNTVHKQCAQEKVVWNSILHLTKLWLCSCWKKNEVTFLYVGYVHILNNKITSTRRFPPVSSIYIYIYNDHSTEFLDL